MNTTFRWVRQQRYALIAAILLLLVGCFTLLYNLEGPEFDRWDEAAFGRLARNALANDSYRVPVTEDGEYAGRLFSKPPLTIWAVAVSIKLLGPTLYAMRLPFALSVLVTAFICFFWGKRLVDRPVWGDLMGLCWGGSLLVCEGTLKWGRMARIEPMFVCFLIAALAAYARTATARGRGLGWAALAGLALTGAFLTKQLACGLAVLPIFVFEVFRSRKALWKEGMARLALAFGLPVLLGAVWVTLAWQKAGKQLFNVMFGFSVAKRFSGFSGTIHFNKLNRIPDLVAEASLPYPWMLGVLGCAFCVYECRRRNKGAEAWLIFSFLMVCTLVLENGTKSVLPWYAFSLVPATLFGSAWLVTQFAQHYALATSASDPDEGSTAAVNVAKAAAVLGAVVIFLVPIASAARVASALNVAVLLSLLSYVAVWQRKRLSSPPLLFGCTVLLVFVTPAFASVRYPGVMTEPATNVALMHAISETGNLRVSVAPKVVSGDLKNYHLEAMFGASAAKRSEPPWDDPRAGAFDVRVDTDIVPLELRPRKGVQLQRVNGGVAYVGDLSSPPFKDSQLEELLLKGPLTFEAEHMTGASIHREWFSQVSGTVRRTEPWLSSHQGEGDLSEARTLEFPSGKYVAVAYVKWDCNGFKGTVATISVGGKSARIDCSPPRSGDYDPVTIRFDLAKPEHLGLAIRFTRGRWMIAHDHTEIWREDVWEKNKNEPRRTPKRD